jgi:hypothetical protein
MNKRLLSNTLMLFIALMVVVSAAGCGSKAYTADNVPVYPGSVVLKPGDDPVADTLANNMAQDASLRQGIGAGGKIEQRAFRLPADANWDAVKAFYEQKLAADGWKSGIGGIGGTIASQALEAANQGSDMMKMAMWSKGKQVLTIFRLMETPDATQSYLIFSLNSN